MQDTLNRITFSLCTRLQCAKQRKYSIFEVVWIYAEYTFGLLTYLTIYVIT